MSKERLIINSGSRTLLLDPGDIIYIEVMDHHVTIHCRKSMFVIRDSLEALERRLAGKGFCRIHRSFLVSLRFVCQCGRDYVLMNDGKETRLPIGSRYRAAFTEALLL